MGVVSPDTPLTRAKFYEWLSEGLKAEYILGEVIIHGPQTFGVTRVTMNILHLLWDETFISQEKCFVGSQKTMISLTENDYMPDASYFGPEKTALFTKDTWQFPAPDLVLEVVTPATEYRDRVIKLKDYAAHGVREYWIVDAEAEIIEQYVLPAGETTYAPGKTLARRDTLTCQAITGLTFPVVAAFDEAENFRARRVFAVPPA